LGQHVSSEKDGLGQTDGGYSSRDGPARVSRSRSVVWRLTKSQSRQKKEKREKHNFNGERPE
jgi:hypothetical protein